MKKEHGIVVAWISVAFVIVGITVTLTLDLRIGLILTAISITFLIMGALPSIKDMRNRAKILSSITTVLQELNMSYISDSLIENIEEDSINYIVLLSDKDIQRCSFGDISNDQRIYVTSEQLKHLIHAIIIYHYANIQQHLLEITIDEGLRDININYAKKLCFDYLYQQIYKYPRSSIEIESTDFAEQLKKIAVASQPQLQIV